MKQVIAAHGWAGDASVWNLWQHRFAARGWQWQSADRGYGGQDCVMPNWSDRSLKRLLVCHSLGPHLLPAPILAKADTIVLLGGFASFVPGGAAGRRQAIALRGMATRLGTAEEGQMLRKFLERCASPLPSTALPPQPQLHVLNDTGRERLRHDLTLLRDCSDLPLGWPKQARTLLVQGGQDAIVNRESQDLLLELLPERLTEVIQEPQLGHALITSAVLKRVLAWVEATP